MLTALVYRFVSRMFAVMDGEGSRPVEFHLILF